MAAHFTFVDPVRDEQLDLFAQPDGQIALDLTNDHTSLEVILTDNDVQALISALQEMRGRP